MKVYQNGQPASPEALHPAAEGIFCVAGPSERAKALKALGLAMPLPMEEPKRRSSHFESQNGFDYISLSIPDDEDVHREKTQIEVFFSGKSLLLVANHSPKADALCRELENRQGPPPAPERILLQFFVRLTGDDAGELEDIEEEVASLEDRMMSLEPDDITAEISRLRKLLLVRKRYYEALVSLLEDLTENENGLFSKTQLRYFRLQSNKADRLFHDVLNLRDYVTQVRESYQNQLDIGLNQTMRLFTVITAVFSPLALIVGWYGMNLQMPEYAHPAAYPIVILLSLAVAGGCLWYFKRKKYF